MSPSDHFNLQRFVDAQASVYGQAVAELRSGRKQSHWMWFIFPQIAGLGSSPTARLFAIHSIAEARAYLEHPLLGSRLRECTHVLIVLSGKTAQEILGAPDNMKFRSCMTLFARATPGEAIFNQALDKYFNGEEDPLTLQLIDK